MVTLRITQTLTVLLLLLGCADDNSNFNLNYPEELINTWVESYEEDYGLYRPSSAMTFPPSWFRQTYTFKTDQICEFLVLSPVDAHAIEVGKWEYDKAHSTIRIYKSNDDLFRELKVISLTSSQMQIER